MNEGGSTGATSQKMKHLNPLIDQRYEERSDAFAIDYNWAHTVTHGIRWWHRFDIGIAASLFTGPTGRVSTGGAGVEVAGGPAQLKRVL